MTKQDFKQISFAALAILLLLSFYGCIEGSPNINDNVVEDGWGRAHPDTYDSMQITSHVMNWLQSSQHEDGSWNASPADTAAVVLLCAANNVLPQQNSRWGAMVSKALQYLVSIQSPSGEYSWEENENCMVICAMIEGFCLTGSPVAENSARRAYVRMMTTTKNVNPWVVRCVLYARVFNESQISQNHFVADVVEKLRLNHDINSLLNLYLLDQITTVETIELNKFLETVSFEKELNNGIDWCYTITEVLFAKGGVQWENWQNEYFRILRRRLVNIETQDSNKLLAYFEPERESEVLHGRTYFTARVAMLFATN